MKANAKLEVGVGNSLPMNEAGAWHQIIAQVTVAARR